MGPQSKFGIGPEVLISGVELAIQVRRPLKLVHSWHCCIASVAVLEMARVSEIAKQ